MRDLVARGPEEEVELLRETIRKIRGLDEERPEDKGLPAINVRFVDADASSD